MRFLKRFYFILFNNIIVNQILILIKKDDYIKKYLNNWRAVRFNQNKSLQENVGFSHRPEIQEAVDSFHQKIKNFIQSINFQNGSVLDIGCGTGLYLNDFDKTKFKLSGTDLNEEFITEARKLIPNGSFYIGDFLDVEFKEKFDFILCVSVIEYISPSKLNSFFKKVYDNLNPGGYFILQYPHATSFKDLLIPDLSYVNYSPVKIQKISDVYFKTIKHEHFLNGKAVELYDKSSYDIGMGKSFRNGYWLIGKKDNNGI